MPRRNLPLAWIACALCALTLAGAARVSGAAPDAQARYDSLLKETRRLVEGKQYPAGETAARELVAYAEGAFGAENPQTGSALTWLSRALREQNKNAEAVPPTERTLRIYEKAYGVEHKMLIPVLFNLGAAYNRLNRFKEGEATLLRALRLDEKIAGAGDPEVATDLIEYSKSLEGLDRFEDARTALSAAVLIREKALGVDQEPTRNARELLKGLPGRQVRKLLEDADAAAKGGDANREAELANQALRVAEASDGPASKRYADSLWRIADAHYRQKQYGEAIKTARRYLAIYDALSPDPNLDKGFGRHNLGVYLLDSGDPGGAQSELQQALEITRKIRGPEGLEAANTERFLARALMEQGKGAEAQALLEHVVRVRTREYGAQDERTVSTQKLLDQAREPRKVAVTPVEPSRPVDVEIPGRPKQPVKFTGFLPDRPDDRTLWGREDTVWARPASDAKEVAGIPDFGSLDLAEYRAAVRQTFAMLRLVYGDLTPDEEQQMQAKWAPHFDYPTPEGLAYFKKLNPLLNRFLTVRAALLLAATDFDAAWERAGVSAGMAEGEPAAEAMNEAARLKDTLVALREELAKVTAEIQALGDPPNPLAARHRARKALDLALAKAQPVESGTPSGRSPLEGEWEGLETQKGVVNPLHVWFLQGRQYMQGEKATVKPVKVGNKTTFQVTRTGGVQRTELFTAFMAGAHYHFASGFVAVSMVERVRADLYRGTFSYFGVNGPMEAAVSGSSLTITCGDTTIRAQRVGTTLGAPPTGWSWTDAQAKRAEAKKIQNAPHSTVKPQSVEEEVRQARDEAERHRQSIALEGQAWLIEGYNQTRQRLHLAFLGWLPKADPDTAPLEARLNDPQIIARADQITREQQGKETGTPPVPVADAGKMVELSPEEQQKARSERIAEIQLDIQASQKNLQAWQAELQAELRRTPPANAGPAWFKAQADRAAQLRGMIVQTISDVQEQQSVIESLQTGTIVRRPTLWDEMAHARFVQTVEQEARRPQFFARAEQQVDGLIQLLPEGERDEMRRWKEQQLAGTPRGAMDVQKLKAVTNVIFQKVQGGAGREEVRAQEWINTCEEIKWGAGVALMVAAPFSTAAGSVWGGRIAAGFGFGTGYIEGGLTGATVAGLRMYSAAVDTAVAAVEGYEATGSFTEAAKNALMTLVLRKALEGAAGRIVRGRAQAKVERFEAWQEAVQRTRFKELQQEAKVFTEQYRQAQAAFENLVSRSKPAGMSRADYLARNGAALAGTPEGKALLEAMGNVESSYTGKVRMNGGGTPPEIRVNYNENLEALIEKPVVGATQALMARLGYNGFKMGQIRHSANRARVGMDHDLAVEEENFTPTKNGKPVTLAEFQKDLNNCLNQAYKQVVGGRTARAADWKGTTSIDPEAYLDRAVLEITKLREQGADTLTILRSLNPKLAEQTGGVNVGKVGHATQKGGPTGTAEACRTLEKELRTKLLDMLPKGSPEQAYFEKIRQALARGTEDPIGAEKEVYRLTGRHLTEVAGLVRNRLVEIIHQVH